MKKCSPVSNLTSGTNLKKKESGVQIEETQKKDEKEVEKANDYKDCVYEDAVAVELPIWRCILDAIGEKIKQMMVPILLVHMVLYVWQCFAMDRMAVKRNMWQLGMRSKNLTNFFREIGNQELYGEIQPLVIYSLNDKQGLTLSMSDVVESGKTSSFHYFHL